jgi:uncharacterized protein (DUF433 family)
MKVQDSKFNWISNTIFHVEFVSLNMEFVHPDFPRISASPDICFGKPRIKNTRMPIASILAYLASGMTIEEFINEFNWITKEDVLEAMAFASMMMGDNFMPVMKNG